MFAFFVLSLLSLLSAFPLALSTFLLFLALTSASLIFSSQLELNTHPTEYISHALIFNRIPMCSNNYRYYNELGYAFYNHISNTTLAEKSTAYTIWTIVIIRYTDQCCASVDIYTIYYSVEHHIAGFGIS